MQDGPVRLLHFTLGRIGVDMVRKYLLYSFVGETILDPFAGSGTTLAAAAKYHRNATGVELGFTDDDTWQEIVADKLQPFLETNQLSFT